MTEIGSRIEADDAVISTYRGTRSPVAEWKNSQANLSGPGLMSVFGQFLAPDRGAIANDAGIIRPFGDARERDGAGGDERRVAGSIFTLRRRG